MGKAGRVGVWLGILLIVVGLVIGFGAMFIDSDSIAVNALGLVPLGFLLLLAGTVASQWSHPERPYNLDNDEHDTQTAEKHRL